MNQQRIQTDWTTTSTVGLSAHDLSVEHRLTKLEQFVEHQREANTKMDKRQTLQERALLILFISVTALAHERIPWLASALIGLMKATPP